MTPQNMVRWLSGLKQLFAKESGCDEQPQGFESLSHLQIMEELSERFWVAETVLKTVCFKKASGFESLLFRQFIVKWPEWIKALHILRSGLKIAPWVRIPSLLPILKIYTIPALSNQTLLNLNL